MIRVKRSAVPVPANLDGETSLGGKERARAIAFFADPANQDGSFDFKAYKDNAVKDSLNQLFHFKCAYCESKYEATQPVDVEHYRPKSAVAINGHLVKPGYYWLAAEWTNMLPSCIDCNRPRTQDFPDVPPELSGKANLFPVADEAHRARRPGDEKTEPRLLLDPCRDFPDSHLEFIEEGMVRSVVKNGKTSRKAEASIQAYGLKRTGLVQMRRDRQVLILAQIHTVRRVLQLLDANPQSADVQDWLADELAELKRYMGDDQPYAGMARQMISPLLSEIHGG